MSSSEGWLIGVGLALTGAVLSAVGYTLQRWSQLRYKHVSKQRYVPAYKQPANVIGVVLGAGDGICEAIAMNYAAESLVASLGTVPIILNMIIAPRFLKEAVGKRDFLVCGMIIVGACLCVFFSNHSSTDMNWAQIYEKFFDVEFIVYFVLMMSALALLMSISSRSRENLPRFEWMSRIFSERMLDRIYSESFFLKFQRSITVVVAAICGSFTAMFGKAIVELIFDAIAGEDDFNQVGPWIVIALILFFFINQVRHLNRSLELYSALMIVPFYETLYSLFGILNGAVYYRDFDGFEYTQTLFFVLGITINCIALLLLTARAETSQDTGDNSISDPKYQGVEMRNSKDSSSRTRSSSESAQFESSPPLP
jgi:drug/metabolite transporter (DMT)-like permease